MKRIIFAFVVFIFISYSPLSAEEIDTVWPNKSWTVTFNTPMDFSQASGSIYVLDEKDQKVAVQLQPSEDQTSVDIVGETPWEFKSGQTYTIYITSDLTSQNGSPLKSTVTKTFQVHEQADQEIQMHNIVVAESTKSDVVEEFGEPVDEAKLSDEYHWESYHNQDYENFVLVLYNSENIVHGYYTNQDLFELSGEHRLSTPFNDLKETYTDRAYIIKNDNDKPERFLIGKEDLTINLFLDVYRSSRLSSVLVLSREAEQTHFHRTEALEAASKMQIFEITNALRANYGMPSLEPNKEIDKVALHHSMDMAENEYFSHVNLEGEGVLERFNKAGLSFKSSGENISAGYATGIEAMEGWINSAGHRKNLLASHDFIGIGVVVDKDSPYGIYFTQDFATN